MTDVQCATCMRGPGSWMSTTYREEGETSMIRVTFWFYVMTHAIGYITAAVSLWTLSRLAICWRQSRTQMDLLMWSFLHPSSIELDYPKTQSHSRSGHWQHESTMPNLANLSGGDHD